MKAYKGFNKKLTSRLGDGKEENCVFKPGETKEVAESKTIRSGFHCCENPFECLAYYGLGEDNRYFIVEAAGDIDEDDGERIACTKITLVEEMSILKLAMEGMDYIINHPDREKWQQAHRHCTVAAGKAEADAPGAIAIARGINPMVKGPAGSILGLLKETTYSPSYQKKESTVITDCKLLKVAPEQQNKWLTINQNRELEVVE